MGIFRVAKFENLHLTPSSPYETPGAEILSKWVPTHPNHFAIMLRFLKNPKTPQKGFEGHPLFDVMSCKRTMERQRISSSGQKETEGSYSWKWGSKCSHHPFTAEVTGEICFDKEVGNVWQSFEVRFDIGEVTVFAIELSKDEECSRRRTMGMTPHPTATNN